VDPNVLAFWKDLIALGIVTGGLLGGAGVLAWTVARWRSLKAGQQANPELLRAMDELRTSVDAVHEDMAEMADRLEFTERALMRLADQKQRQLPES
jgi:hypothetical protein